jgi:homoserine O-acetyltransferase/O-succinyltransferase
MLLFFTFISCSSNARWGPLMGQGKAFDPNRYFIFCGNTLGSPYGSASPVSKNPATREPYGPEFPATTIRDDVRYALVLLCFWCMVDFFFLRIHKLVLDNLGVSSVAVAIGGSMGGMTVLEWPLCTPRGYVRNIVPIATSARHSAWCISWGEAQRQSIYSDPGYSGGYYGLQPASGLAAARMAAILTYRSRDSFQNRFGRKAQPQTQSLLPTPPGSPSRSSADALLAHNDGLKSTTNGSQPSTPELPSKPPSPKPQIFSAQSYLRYQGDKFAARFDANCYIHLTRKLDSHDIARDRFPSNITDETQALRHVLATLPPRALVIGIQSDGLFTPNEQTELASHIPDAELVMIPSLEGHDGFLLEFEVINGHLLKFLRNELPELYVGNLDVVDVPVTGFEVKKTSMFGEAEVDIARW